MVTKPTVKPPPAGFSSSVVAPRCRHDYIFLRSEYQRDDGPYKSNYQQIDVFHCRHCLDYKRVVARNEDERCQPTWYKG